MFGRKKAQEDTRPPRHRRAEEGELGGELDEQVDDEHIAAGHDAAEGAPLVPAQGGEPRLGRTAEVPGGPWDSATVSDPGERLDLGALWLPGIPGMELRLEVEEATGNVVSAVCLLGQSAVQLRAFAAPRSGGLWPEIRRDIVDDIREQGGEAEEHVGPLGDEIQAQMQVPDPDGRPSLQQARFVGFEGPRWLLHGVFTGEAATDPFSAAALEDLFRDVVVVRGDEPMARGEVLPLRLPAEATPESDASDGASSAGQPTLEPFQRGPEITEIR